MHNDGANCTTLHQIGIGRKETNTRSRDENQFQQSISATGVWYHLIEQTRRRPTPALTVMRHTCNANIKEVITNDGEIICLNGERLAFIRDHARMQVALEDTGLHHIRSTAVRSIGGHVANQRQHDNLHHSIARVVDRHSCTRRASWHRCNHSGNKQRCTLYAIRVIWQSFVDGGVVQQSELSNNTHEALSRSQIELTC